MTALILRNKDNLKRAINHLLCLDMSSPWEVVVKPFKSKRSTAQNRLLWKWYGELAEQTGHTPDEIHEYCKRRFLGAEYKTILGVEIEITASTADKKVTEFADYLTRIEAMAAENGYTLTQPLDYRLAMYGERI